MRAERQGKIVVSVDVVRVELDGLFVFVNRAFEVALLAPLMQCDPEIVSHVSVVRLELDRTSWGEGESSVRLSVRVTTA